MYNRQDSSLKRQNIFIIPFKAGIIYKDKECVFECFRHTLVSLQHCFSSCCVYFICSTVLSAKLRGGHQPRYQSFLGFWLEVGPTHLYLADGQPSLQSQYIITIIDVNIIITKSRKLLITFIIYRWSLKLLALYVLVLYGRIKWNHLCFTKKKLTLLEVFKLSEMPVVCDLSLIFKIIKKKKNMWKPLRPKNQTWVRYLKKEKLNWALTLIMHNE